MVFRYSQYLWLFLFLKPKCYTSNCTMVALYNKKGLSVLNVQYDAKNSPTCDYMIHYTSKLDTVLRVMIWLTEVNVHCNTIFFTEKHKVCWSDRVEQKVTTNPKLGQNHKSRSTEEADNNYVLIVFIVTVYTAGGCMKWRYMCFSGTLEKSAYY